MSRPERIGVLGGTFDPIHRTHVAIARTARAEAHLDRVLFVVAACPPHKYGDAHAPVHDRLAMVRAALAQEPAMEASTLEIERAGLSYTVDTLRELQREHPDAQLFLIMGEDSLADLPVWRDPDGILEIAQILVAPRPGGRRAVSPELAGRITFLSSKESFVSSTEVRERIAQGCDVRAYVLPEVERFIRENGLYHAAPYPDTL